MSLNIQALRYLIIDGVHGEEFGRPELFYDRWGVPVGRDFAVCNLIKNTQRTFAVNLMRYFFGRFHKNSGIFSEFFK